MDTANVFSVNVPGQKRVNKGVFSQAKTVIQGQTESVRIFIINVFAVDHVMHYVLCLVAVFGLS